jgi:hypothetical protein
VQPEASKLSKADFVPSQSAREGLHVKVVRRSSQSDRAKEAIAANAKLFH